MQTVLNHVFSAGAAGGQGGSDPAAWNDKFTNFRCNTLKLVDKLSFHYIILKNVFN